jgi:predicted DNA-binding protein (MmcQ/YjbR family)
MATDRDTLHPILPRSPAEELLANRLRKICMALPEANEKLSHGEPTWFAGRGKVFAMLDSHHHGSSHLAVWLPLPQGAQEEVIDADPKRFFRPPYVGARGWVGVILDTKPSWAMIESMVRDAYLHVATAKLKSLLAKRG